MKRNPTKSASPISGNAVVPSQPAPVPENKNFDILDMESPDDKKIGAIDKNSHENQSFNDVFDMNTP